MTIGSRRLRFVLFFSPLTGCTVGPDYRPLDAAALKAPAAFVAPAPETVGEVDVARWWTSFDDPALTWLVERALRSNLDIDAAGARVRQAREQLVQTRASLFPTLDLSGSVSRTIGQSSGTSTIITNGTGTGGATGATDTGGTTGAGGTGGVSTGTFSTRGGDVTIYRAGFDAAYEVDLFGGIRRSVQAARADAQASEAQLHNTQLSVASEVGLNYVDARLAQQRLKIAQDNLASQDETLQIVGWRVQAGLVSALDYEQARQLRAQTAATIPTIEVSYRQAVNRLAVLVGEAPGSVDTVMAPVRPVPLAPADLSATIPAQVLQRRPDVAAAERQVAAETARVGVQTAALYPALRLSGTISGSGTKIADVVSDAVGDLIASLSAPIFEGGRLRAAVRGQRAAADAALATYRGTVLTAFEDSSNALTQLSSAERRERELIVAEDASRNAVTYARSQYRAGLIDFQSLLETERSLLTSQDSRATAHADRATATVQLYKALGGGWQSAPVPATLAGGVAPYLSRP